MSITFHNSTLIYRDETEDRIRSCRQFRSDYLRNSSKALLSAICISALRVNFLSHLSAPLRRLRLLTHSVRHRLPAVISPGGAAEAQSVQPLLVVAAGPLGVAGPAAVVIVSETDAVVIGTTAAAGRAG